MKREDEKEEDEEEGKKAREGKERVPWEGSPERNRR